jgi:hypothetical protein
MAVLSAESSMWTRKARIGRDARVDLAERRSAMVRGEGSRVKLLLRIPGIGAGRLSGIFQGCIGSGSTRGKVVEYRVVAESG